MYIKDEGMYQNPSSVTLLVDSQLLKAINTLNYKFSDMFYFSSKIYVTIKVRRSNVRVLKSLSINV